MNVILFLLIDFVLWSHIILWYLSHSFLHILHTQMLFDWWTQFFYSFMMETMCWQSCYCVKKYIKMKEREWHLPQLCLETSLEQTNHDENCWNRSFQPALWLSSAVEVDWSVCPSYVSTHKSGRYRSLSFILIIFLSFTFQSFPLVIVWHLWFCPIH